MAIMHYSDPDFFVNFSLGRMAFAPELAKSVGSGSGARPISADPHAATVLIYELAPGGRLPRHAHNAHRIECIVRGEMTMEDGVVMRPGDVQITAPGEFYGPAIGGPEGAVSIEILSSSDPAEVAMIFPEDQSPEDAELAAILREARARLVGEPE